MEKALNFVHETSGLSHDIIAAFRVSRVVLVCCILRIVYDIIDVTVQFLFIYFLKTVVF